MTSSSPMPVINLLSFCNFYTVSRLMKFVVSASLTDVMDHGLNWQHSCCLIWVKVIKLLIILKKTLEDWLNIPPPPTTTALPIIHYLLHDTGPSLSKVRMHYPSDKLPWYVLGTLTCLACKQAAQLWQVKWTVKECASKLPTLAHIRVSLSGGSSSMTFATPLRAYSQIIKK